MKQIYSGILSSLLETFEALPDTGNAFVKLRGESLRADAECVVLDTEESDYDIWADELEAQGYAHAFSFSDLEDIKINLAEQLVEGSRAVSFEEAVLYYHGHDAFIRV